jgi:hypothetical protein
MPDEHQIVDRLFTIFKKLPPCRDEFQQWAVDVMPEYQNILDECGLGAYAVVGGYPNDHWLDEIKLRAPWGEELDVPSPEEVGEDETSPGGSETLRDPAFVFRVEDGPTWCIESLARFFTELCSKVTISDRVQNMREAIRYLEALCADPDFKRSDRYLKEAMLHISVAMRPEPEIVE